MTVFIETSGIDNFKKFLTDFPVIARQSASIALNQTAERKGLKLARQEILQQVAFPAGYLNGTRLSVSKKASPSNLISVIRGQFEATPLARFSSGQRTSFIRARTHGKKVSRPTIRVQIKPGSSVELKRAFFLTLRNGNIGLGVRLKPGEVLQHSIGAKLITSGPLRGVYLLYGPSIDQVFRTVAADIIPELTLELQSEFLRQFAFRVGNA